MKALFRFTALSVVLSGLFFFPPALPAQPAEQFLHSGANMYIQGRIQEASIEVEEGLNRHPHDKRLANFAEFLKQLKQEQKRQSQDGENRQDKQEQQDGNSDSSGQERKQEPGEDEKPPEKPESGKDGEKEEEEEEKKEQPPDASGEEDESEQEQPRDSAGAGAPEQPEPGQMSQEEAERLLKAYEGDEKELRRKMRPGKKGRESDVDW